MKVIEIEGNLVTFDLSEGEVQVLLRFAINKILAEYLEKEEKR